MKSLTTALLTLAALSSLAACGNETTSPSTETATVTIDGQCGIISKSRTKGRHILSVSKTEKYNLEAADGSALNALNEAARTGKSTCVFGDYRENPVIVGSSSDVVTKK